MVFAVTWLDDHQRRLPSAIEVIDKHIAEQFVDSFSYLERIGLVTSKVGDSTDILKQRGNFISQMNNMLCYFSKLKSCVKITFQSFLMSMGASCGFSASVCCMAERFA